VAVYLIRRLIFSVPTLLGVSLVTFALMHAAPGGPFDTDAILPDATKRLLLAKYHLDLPVWQQYLLYLRGTVTGDLGTSIRNPGVTVTDLIASRFAVSLQLGLAALVVTLAVGLPLGVIAATHHNRWADRLAMLTSLAGYSVPNFVVGVVLLLIFAVILKLVPVGGWGAPNQFILPAIALGLPWSSIIGRLVRANMLEVLGQDYVRTARSKGLDPPHVLIRHALRNAMIPTVTVTGILTADLITGSMVIETIFGIPGLGQYFVGSILNSDYPVIMGTALFYALLLVLMNLLVDVVYSYLDPRIRYG
jgi:oligopeptide transport system permease protein